MKQFSCLSTFEERKSFINDLFQTKMFKSSMTSDWFKTLIHDFCKYPRFIGSYTDQKIEHAHFYSWFNILIIRQYDNLVIQDLYYLHELKHITSMSYDHHLKFEKWKEKMIDNELGAALLSEVQVYDRIKDLRSFSFNYKIWYDEVPRYILDNEDTLRSYRRQAMNNPKTEVEKTLHLYKKSNDKWAAIWKSNYKNVEKMMNIFYSLAAYNPSLAIEVYLETLEQYKDKNTDILFLEEAKAFTDSYLKLKEETKT